MPRNETSGSARRCTAPVEQNGKLVGCDQPYYSSGYCEGHARRVRRAEERGEAPNLTRPVRPRTGEKTDSVSGRITESSLVYYLAHPSGEYGAVSQVLEQHAKRHLKRLNPEERTRMAARAAEVIATRELSRQKRKQGRPAPRARKKA